MESRASHILVGGFVLILLAAAVAFTIWLAKVDLDAEYNDYDIYFHGSVSGLYNRSVVYYLGIPVGEVMDIGLSPIDPARIHVWVRLRSDVPINEGTRATLAYQGFTGVAFIELIGGELGNPPIEPHPGAPRPEIPSEASPFQEIFQSAPDLVNQAILAVVQVQKLFSDDNIAALRAVVDNSARLTGNLADGTEDMDLLMADLRATLSQVRDTAESFRLLADSGTELLDGDGQQMVAEAVEALRSANSMLSRIDGLVAANEQAVTQFLSGSLPEVSRMIIDLRITSRALARLVSRIEQNPAEVLFGPNKRTYDLENRSLEDEN